ncbi:hypothetical protein AX768_02120 [Burkholderia sp. PAMC 28687]|nr:hypothetical protein AX768_02120 [Burkholderia sp. PAMC 28687]
MGGIVPCVKRIKRDVYCALSGADSPSNTVVHSDITGITERILLLADLIQVECNGAFVHTSFADFYFEAVIPKTVLIQFQVGDFWFDSDIQKFHMRTRVGWLEVALCRPGNRSAADALPLVGLFDCVTRHSCPE